MFNHGVDLISKNVPNYNYKSICTNVVNVIQLGSLVVAAQQKVIFGGRLAEYQYYDMHQVVERALTIDLGG